MAIAFTPENARLSAPTNPMFQTGGTSISDGHRFYSAIFLDDTPSFTVDFFGGSTTELSNLSNTKGFKIKCYDTNTNEGIIFNPGDFATRNYYVMVHSDNDKMHHFARIKEIKTEDALGDAFEFSPKLGKEIPKDSKFLIFTGNLKTIPVVAISLGVLQDSTSLDLQDNNICARPLWYFFNDNELTDNNNFTSFLDKDNQLNHNTKYYVAHHGGSIPPFTLAQYSSSFQSGLTFMTVPDFGKQLIDYSKYSLNITLTDKLRDTDLTFEALLNGVGGTTAEGVSINHFSHYYGYSFPNARRDETNSTQSNNGFKGQSRYLHYNYSPFKANITYGVIRHLSTDAIGSKGGFSESSIIDSARIMNKKIKEFDDYTVRHKIHTGDTEDFFSLPANYSSTNNINDFEFITDYDLNAVLTEGDEVRIDDTVLIVHNIGTFLIGNTQSIAFKNEIRNYESAVFATSSFTPTNNAVLKRRTFNSSSNTLMVDIKLIDSRYSKLYVSFTSKNMNDLYASVSACDAKRKMVTLQFEGDSYAGNPLRFCNGEYILFVQRFEGEIEQKEIKKEEGQTIMEIKGRDTFNKLLSPIINSNKLYSEDIIYSSNSPYNKVGDMNVGSTYSIAIGDTEIETNILYMTSAFDIFPSIGSKLFSSKGYIGEVTAHNYHASVKLKLMITPAILSTTAEPIYLETEKNYIFSKALSSSHLAEVKPTSLTGSSEKGVLFTSGKTIHTDGTDNTNNSIELVSSSATSHPNAIGYAVNEPSSVLNTQNNFQCKLKDEFDSNTFSSFDVVDTLMDFEIIESQTKDGRTTIELAPYLPLALGKEWQLHKDDSDNTYTEVATVVTPDPLFQPSGSFTTDSTTAATLKKGDSLYWGDTKTYLGDIIYIHVESTSGSLLLHIMLDGTVRTLVTGDKIYTSDSKTYDITFINGAHMWGGKCFTLPHPKLTSTGAVPLNFQNVVRTKDMYDTYGQPYYISTGMHFGSNYDDLPHLEFGYIGLGLQNNGIDIRQRLNRHTHKYYSPSYKIKTNLGANNIVSSPYINSDYFTLPITQRGRLPPNGSKYGGMERVHENSVWNRHPSDSIFTPYAQMVTMQDESINRSFIYINSDILPYSSLRNSSLLHKTGGVGTKDISNYNLFLVQNDNILHPDSVLKLEDKNFQSLNFTSDADVSNLNRFSMMRLTECVYDIHYNPLNPELPIPEKFNTLGLQSPVKLYKETALDTISSIVGTTITFSGFVTLNSGDKIYDDTGMLIGEIASSNGYFHTHTLVADGFYTKPNESTPAITTGTAYKIELVGQQDMKKKSGNALTKIHNGTSYHSGAIMPIKTVSSGGAFRTIDASEDNGIGQYNNTAPTTGGIIGQNANPNPPTDFTNCEGMEIVTPIAFDRSLGSPVALSNSDVKTGTVRHIAALHSGVTYNSPYKGTIGVVLERFDVEDGPLIKSEVGQTTDVLQDPVEFIMYSMGGLGESQYIGLTAGKHFKQYIAYATECDYTTTGKDSGGKVSNPDNPPFLVDGISLGLKLRFWYAAGTGTVGVVKSSNGDIHIYTQNSSSAFNSWLPYVDITGCYLVAENGRQTTGGVSGNTPTETLAGECHNRLADDIIYVISHEVNDSDPTKNSLLLDRPLTADTAYRIMQPNDIFSHSFSPEEITPYLMSHRYTKMPDENKTYKKIEQYFAQTTKGITSGVPPESEGILSMYVVLDPDKQTTNDYLVIRDRTKLKDYFSTGSSTYYISDGKNGTKQSINFRPITNLADSVNQHRLTLEKSKELHGIVSFSEPFTVFSNEELRIDPTRACIGTTVNVGLEAEELVNELLEEEDISFHVVKNDYPLFVAPDYKGITLFDAINNVLSKKQMRLIEENKVFKITPDNNNSHYNDIVLNDTGDYSIYEFEQVSTVFDYYNEVIVYGRTHKSVRKDIRSVKKQGRKTLEEYDDSLMTQIETDKLAQKLLMVHSKLNQKIKITVDSKGLQQLRAGDTIYVHIERENIQMAQYIVLQISYDLQGLMVLDLGKYGKDMADLFADLIIDSRHKDAKDNNNVNDTNSNSFDFLEEFKLKELKLLVRKRASGGGTLGFSTPLNTSTTPLGLASDFVITDLIEEDLI